MSLSAWQLGMRCILGGRPMYLTAETHKVLFGRSTECRTAMSRHEKYDRETNRQTNKWSISISSHRMPCQAQTHIYSRDLSSSSKPSKMASSQTGRVTVSKVQPNIAESVACKALCTAGPCVCFCFLSHSY